MSCVSQLEEIVMSVLIWRANVRPYVSTSQSLHSLQGGRGDGPPPFPSLFLPLKQHFDNAATVERRALGCELGVPLYLPF